MTALDRRQAIAVAAWIGICVVVWNGIYDLLLTRGVKDYLLRHAMFEAGRLRRDVVLADAMAVNVSYAAWMATIWACAILLAGLWTVRAFGARRSGLGARTEAQDERPGTRDSGPGTRD